MWDDEDNPYDMVPRRRVRTSQGWNGFHEREMYLDEAIREVLTEEDDRGERVRRAIDVLCDVVVALVEKRVLSLADLGFHDFKEIDQTRKETRDV